ATPVLYALSLHDALPICDDLFVVPRRRMAEEHVAEPVDLEPLRQREGAEPGGILVAERRGHKSVQVVAALVAGEKPVGVAADPRSEEHTSELQSLAYLVC